MSIFRLEMAGQDVGRLSAGCQMFPAGNLPRAAGCLPARAKCLRGLQTGGKGNDLIQRNKEGGVSEVLLGGEWHGR